MFTSASAFGLGGSAAFDGPVGFGGALFQLKYSLNQKKRKLDDIKSYDTNGKTREELKQHIDDEFDARDLVTDAELALNGSAEYMAELLCERIKAAVKAEKSAVKAREFANIAIEKADRAEEFARIARIAAV